MSKITFVEYLNSVTPLSVLFKEELTANLHEEKYTARQILNAAGQTENRLWFVSEGFARSYYYDTSGKQHTLNFFKENDLIFSFDGFWRKPSDYYIETLRPAKLISLSYKDLNRLFKFIETGDLVKIFIIQQHKSEKFKSKLMDETLKDRCRHFRETHPEIFRKATVGLIASYLNVTREYLSRLISDDFR